LTAARAPRGSRASEHARLRRAAASILQAGLAAADPAKLVRERLRLRGGALHAFGVAHALEHGRVLLVAAGKAAAVMACAAEERLGRHLHHGIAVAAAPGPRLRRTRLLVAGHPLPDRRGLRAAVEVERLLAGLRPEDLVLVLLSGGASALLPAPVPGVSLSDKAELTSLLLRAGATIHELNCVRKHLSRLKGGGLARAAAPARVIALVLSDVVGDDLSTIASGPTVPDPTSFADALAVLRARGILRRAPRAVVAHLAAGARGERTETPKPGDPALARTVTRVVGSNRLSLLAAAWRARRLGFATLALTSRLEGEAREVARVLVSILRECVETGRPRRPPVCLLASGETTVAVTGRGNGGRNQELAVAAARPLCAVPAPAVVASFATDGIDGPTDAAGGVVDGDTLARADALGLLPPEAFLKHNDAYALLASLGDLIKTGPTGTNVMDLAVLLSSGIRLRSAGPRSS
jgi:hydroxypyruvate reductase